MANDPIMLPRKGVKVFCNSLGAAMRMRQEVVAIEIMLEMDRFKYFCNHRVYSK